MEKTENCEECANRFQILKNKIEFFFNKKKKIITKEEAFNETTYGKCMTREQYILNKQVDVNAQIRDKLGNPAFNNTDFDKYFLVVSFNETEEECSKEIFEPFIKDGYKVDRLSDALESLKYTNVYLISWKN